MNKADKYLKETITEIIEDGQWDKNPRTKWADGTPAHSKFITQKVYQYDVIKGEFPINTLRTTALKGGFYDIEAIYIKQTNIVEEMHPSIHSWWKDFVTGVYTRYFRKDKPNIVKYIHPWEENFRDFSSDLLVVERGVENIGQTYGHTVERYDLMNKLLKGLEENPFSRRHIIDMWQEQQMIDDPQALPPCAYSTLWSVRDQDNAKLVSEGWKNVSSFTRYIDLTLIQRSQDYVTTSSINPAQYTMFAMAVCNHLTFKTGIKHQVGKLLHIVQNCHIYDKHLESAQEILKREPTGLQPKIELICEPKDFYKHTIEDFKFTGLEGIKPLTEKLEIAI